MTVYTTSAGPLGELLLVGEVSATAKGGTALASLSAPGQKGGVTVQEGWVREPAAFEEVCGQLGVRSVGTAIGRNPMLVVRPCHRVIGADGALRGYAGGLNAKERLLDLEGGWAP
jgi:methylated-DNA-[protein]-cysteine S-methyltransferase